VAPGGVAALRGEDGGNKTTFSAAVVFLLFFHMSLGGNQDFIYFFGRNCEFAF